MLPKEKRIRSSRDFKRVYQKGSFFSVPGLAVNFLSNRMALSRLGIVVTKKTEPKAVRRNLLKRKIRESARKLYESLPPGYDIVITVKDARGLSSFEKIEESMKAIGGRIKEK